MLSFHLWPSGFHPEIHDCIRLPPYVKGTNIGVSSPRVTEKKPIKRWQTVKETANPSSEKMTTVGRVIGLKGMPISKTLVGSFHQPRHDRDTRRKRKNSTYMPNFVDKPNETIKYRGQSWQPGLLRPFFWVSRELKMETFSGRRQLRIL